MLRAVKCTGVITFHSAAWIPHDSWRATVFLLHVPFYGHQLGAYNVFCEEKPSAPWLHHVFFQYNDHPIIPSTHLSTHLFAQHCCGVPDFFSKDSCFWHQFLYDFGSKTYEEEFLQIFMTLNRMINDVPLEKYWFVLMGHLTCRFSSRFGGNKLNSYSLGNI